MINVFDFSRNSNFLLIFQFEVNFQSYSCSQKNENGKLLLEEFVSINSSDIFWIIVMKIKGNVSEKFGDSFDFFYLICFYLSAILKAVAIFQIDPKLLFS